MLCQSSILNGKREDVKGDLNQARPRRRPATGQCPENRATGAWSGHPGILLFPGRAQKLGWGRGQAWLVGLL